MSEGISRFRSLSTVWPEGPEQLISDWKKKGFQVQSLSQSQINYFKTHWTSFKTPSSLTMPALMTSYTFSKEQNHPTSFGLVVSEKNTTEAPNILVVDHVEAAFDFILHKVAHKLWYGRSVDTPEDVHCESHVQVGPNCVFGEGVILESGVRLGAGVHIGNHTRIGANSVIGDDCQIGHHCHFKSHVTIGGTGFGLIRYPKEDFPRVRKHVGRVVIGDHVNIGSFVAVDRGVLQDTLIDRGSCLDNFIQVAHNCHLGSNNILCGFVGLSGSTEFGNNVTCGGMVATKGHLKVGDNVTIAGISGLISDVEPNSQIKGYPPLPVAEALKLQVLVGKLPEFYERLRAVEKTQK